MRKYGLEFDIAEGQKDLRGLEDFLMHQRGGYPQKAYEQWVVETCIPGVDRDERRALIWRQEGAIIGDAVIVPRSDDHVTLKHFRVEAGTLAGRGMGRFMMMQVFPEAIDILNDKGMVTSGANEISIDLDVTKGNSAQAFFERFGFLEQNEAGLYTPDQTEVIMQRTVELV